MRNKYVANGISKNYVLAHQNSVRIIKDIRKTVKIIRKK